MGSTGAELAAVTATVLALVSSIPQLRRILVVGDVVGVSVSFATLGLASELVWIVYAVHGRLWTAVPEAVAMSASNGVMATALMRAGVARRRAVVAAIAWIAVLVLTAVLMGAAGVAVVLGLAYTVQTAPSIWTAYRTRSPSGVATATWVLTGIESVLWGVYGYAHGDPAICGFAIIGSAAAAAILVRKLVTRNRHAPSNEFLSPWAGARQLPPVPYGARV